jgi:predicted ATP-grasp superfamily ATP-dependent carboligase
MPASDERTVAVSRHKAPLGARYLVACPDWDITEQFIDKTKTNVVAERAGVAIPKTVIPAGAGRAGVSRCRDRLPAATEPAKSLLFYEHFIRKMVCAETFAELRRWYTRSSDARLQVILQEIVSGPDSSVVNYKHLRMERWRWGSSTRFGCHEQSCNSCPEGRVSQRRWRSPAPTGDRRVTGMKTLAHACR